MPPWLQLTASAEPLGGYELALRLAWAAGFGFVVAAVYFVSLFGFVIWVVLLISWLFFAGLKPPLAS